jgi:hypothetical protein
MFCCCICLKFHPRDSLSPCVCRYTAILFRLVAPSQCPLPVAKARERKPKPKKAAVARKTASRATTKRVANTQSQREAAAQRGTSAHTETSPRRPRPRSCLALTPPRRRTSRGGGAVLRKGNETPFDGAPFPSERCRSGRLKLGANSADHEWPRSTASNGSGIETA